MSRENNVAITSYLAFDNLEIIASNINEETTSMNGVTSATDSSSSGATSKDAETSFHQTSSINSESTIPINLNTSSSTGFSTGSTSSSTSSNDQSITHELTSTKSSSTFSTSDSAEETSHITTTISSQSTSTRKKQHIDVNSTDSKHINKASH